MAGSTLMLREFPMAEECPSASVQFEELYVHYHDSIYRYLYRLVARTDPASDLTQDVFVQLHRHLQGDVQLKNPRAWLYAVASNLGYNHLRREQRLMKLILKWPPLLSRTLSPEQKYAGMNSIRWHGRRSADCRYVNKFCCSFFRMV